jgi:hypothetical protein
MAQIRDREGKAQEVNVSLEDYKAALSEGLSFPAYLKTKFPTDEAKYGTPFEQMLATSGFFLREDRAAGIRPPTVKQMLEANGNEISMGPLVRPDGSQALTITGRLLFAATVLELVESALLEDTSSYAATWNRLIAVTTSVDTPRVDIPTITSTGPRSDRSMPIAQSATPPNMTSISLSSKSYRMPTFSIGLEITYEAQQAVTLDLVNIILKQQAEGERIALIDEAIKKLVDGDADWGLSALSADVIKNYDSSISSNGVMTHTAWIKWLRSDSRRKTINWVIGDLDAFLAIEKRTDRPVVTGDRGTDERLNSVPLLADVRLPQQVNFFDVPTSVLGANVIVGLDSTKGIRKWTYTGAQYEAVEDFVLRKATALRIDWSEAYGRLFDEAFQKTTLTTS